tara:strand:- start:473 stop:577 length:105 start_codon:yes stop_codon:yes gene_type:complete
LLVVAVAVQVDYLVLPVVLVVTLNLRAPTYLPVL